MSVRPSVGLSFPRFYRMTNRAVFEGKKSANDMSNGTMSDDEAVASDVPPRYLLILTIPFAIKREIPGIPAVERFKEDMIVVVQSNI